MPSPQQWLFTSRADGEIYRLRPLSIIELLLIKVQTDSDERRSRLNQEALESYLEAIMLVSVLGKLIINFLKHRYRKRIGTCVFRYLSLIHVNVPETNLQNRAGVKIVSLICTINFIKMHELTVGIHLHLKPRSGADEKAENGTVMVECYNQEDGNGFQLNCCYFRAFSKHVC